MKNWNVGCSGFYYKHWKEFFYPKGLPQKKWFEYYCEHFHTVELNVTFYRFPQLSFLQSWYERSPENFKFAVKAPKLITHFKQFNDSKSLTNDFYDVVDRGLSDKLGCVLFQLPPRSAYTEERLEKIFNTLDFSVPNVLEFRHVSWWNEKVYKILAEYKVAFCGMSHPLLPDSVIQNVPLVYYRFHGVPELYKSPYSEEFLKNTINNISSNKQAKDVFLYFNNDIGGSAIVNAKQTQDLIIM
ncbi:MAG: hypothetical protein JWN56_1449 [Sphingobacteriales bacterium]|nr:hypothetical protein [Sphingobacteriales bacterium]